MVKVLNQSLNKASNVLVVAPHADDEILGCGGTISKHIKDRDNVNIIICTNANKGDSKTFSKKYIKDLRNEALNAHKIIGKMNTIFLEFPAPNLDIFPVSKISDKLSKFFLKIQPDILYIPFENDLHADHQKIHNACIVASRVKNNIKIKKILSYEVLSETDLNYSNNSSSFSPNYFVNISKFIDIKLKAMKCYKSQLQKYPNSRSLKSIEALSIYRGAGVCYKNAEAFMVNRYINE